jgi:hypothetical protein
MNSDRTYFLDLPVRQCLRTTAASAHYSEDSMNVKNLLAAALVAALAALSLANSSLAEDAPKKAPPSAAQPEFKLPPGWTAADMQACILASTPGKMQKRLTKEAGEWSGTCTMWMGAETPPVKSPCSCKVTPLMEGRFVKVEHAGEIPGMGPYQGFGIYGFDNVAQKFTSVWIDNHGTGMMKGTGELTPDGKKLTWTYDFTCPITQKPAVMREIETITGPTTKTLEMFGADPKSGKEYKMMSIELTKK